MLTTLTQSFDRNRAFRRAYEVRSAGVWAAAALCAVPVSDFRLLNPGLAAALFTASVSFYGLRLRQARQVLEKRSRLDGFPTARMPRESLSHFREPGSVFLGFGFPWTADETEKLLAFDVAGSPDLTLSGSERKLLALKPGRAKEDDGLGLLHAMGEAEEPIQVPLHFFNSGLGIIGTTRAGKGVMLNVLITQAVERGDVVIIIDPKFSERLYEGTVAACRNAGRDAPLLFHAAHPEKSVRFDFFRIQEDVEQIATRLTQALPAGSDETFRSFAWSAVNTIAKLQVYLGEKPSLKPTLFYMAHGVDALLDRALVRLMDAQPPARGWMKRVRQGEKSLRPGDEVPMPRLRMLWYQKEGSLEHPVPAIDGGIKVATQSREYYSKITQSLLPLLEKLCGGQLGAMLSPDYEDLSDPRPIWDFEHVIDHGQVLYIGLNALSDIQTARSLGSLVLSDLSSLIGNRYNLGKNGERISLFVDELSNVVNPSLIEILNKGAEGGVYSTCAMQTIADLEVELHGESGARKVVGNLNNKIILRSVDNTTCQFAVEAIGTALVKQADSASSTSSGDGALGMDYSGGDALRVTLTEKDLIPAHVIGKLPTAEFFALCGAKRVWKGRVPILTDHDPEREDSESKSQDGKTLLARMLQNDRFAEWLAPIKKYLPLIAKPCPGESREQAEERCTARLFCDWVLHETEKRLSTQKESMTKKSDSPQAKDPRSNKRCNTCLACPERADCACGHHIKEPPCAGVCERETCEGCPPEGIPRARPGVKPSRP